MKNNIYPQEIHFLWIKKSLTEESFFQIMETLFIRKEVFQDENDISAEEAAESQGAWFPFQDEHQRRQKGSGSPQGEGQKAAVCVNRFVSLKKNRDFGEVYQQGRSYGNRLLVMYVLEKSQDHESRVGISVSKKVGNSVVRHRIRRLIRESFRTSCENWKDGCDIVIIAKKEAKEKDFRQIESALTHLGKHHKIYHDKGEKI